MARKCDTSVRKSRSENPERERKKFLSRCTRVTASLLHGENVHSYAVKCTPLYVAPVPPRSHRSVETRSAPGSRARLVRGALWRNQPRNIAVCLLHGQVTSALSRSIFGLFSEKKLGGGFLEQGGKNLVSDCLQLPPSIRSSAAETTQIDLFYTL